MNQLTSFVLLFAGSFFPLFPSANAQKPIKEKKLSFPNRPRFPKLPYLDTKGLEAILSKAILIDARNHIEFNVIHIKGAINLPVGKMKKKDLLKIRKTQGSKPIVFYCNGTTCQKSYKAGEKARIWGWKNFFVYDSGIFHWTKKHPKTVLFFDKPVDKNALAKIGDKKSFSMVCLSPLAFAKKALSNQGYKVFDLRDRKERSESPLRLPRVAKLNMDKFVKALKNNRIRKNKLLIFDSSGKQVKWLRYYLNQHGVQDFWLLKGGVIAWKKAGLDASGKPAK
jgi:rhodanese-related sulfurtransferase